MGKRLAYYIIDIPLAIESLVNSRAVQGRRKEKMIYVTEEGEHYIKYKGKEVNVQLRPGWSPLYDATAIGIRKEGH